VAAHRSGKKKQVLFIDVQLRFDLFYAPLTKPLLPEKIAGSRMFINVICNYNKKNLPDENCNV